MIFGFRELTTAQANLSMNPPYSESLQCVILFLTEVSVHRLLILVVSAWCLGQCGALFSISLFYCAMWGMFEWLFHVNDEDRQPLFGGMCKGWF